MGGRKGGKSRVGSSRVASEPNQEGLVVWLFVKKKIVVVVVFLGFFGGARCSSVVRAFRL